LADANGAMKLEIAAHERTRLDLERLFSSSLELLALNRMDAFILRANAAFCAAMGLQVSELENRFFADFVLPQDLPVVADALARAATGAIISDVVVRVVTRAGVTLETQWSLVPFPDGLRFYATGRDITQRTKLEESLRRTLHELREAQRIGGVGSWQVNLDTGVSTWSDETFRIFGYKPGEVTPDDKLTFDSIHPDDRERVRQIADRPRRPGEQHPIEYRLLRQGEVRDISANMEFVQGLDGRSPVLRGTCQDVTDRKRAETRRVRLEEQLRASQKMEAVGSLAGGIAHDFNNLLSVILSYVGFALDATPVTDPRHADLLEVRKAADRAAELTRQLLAFGRKQVLQPVSLNLNQVAAGMESMLRRIIGEDVTLAQKLDPQLGQTMADPGQIEQVLMNLVVNARDAMPRGGRLTIETGNVEVDTQPAIGLAAGPYVVLSVTDTGIGMDAATKAHMFEPFFTTKEVGKGTGLGLPTAYGIIRQSGGNITVYSEPGVGSTFRVYLPQAPSASETRLADPAASLMAGGNETILVVEDEPGVRQSTSRILGARGYKVLTAENGQDALRVSLEHEGVIDLVLTDVVMPRMGGVMLARQMSMRRPQARILFMSGYSGDAIARDGALDPGTQFIGKPFSATDLTRKVRQLLDSGRPDYPTDDTQAPPHPVSPKESP
jgi:PAS domain S-box-containing protein